MNLTLQVASRSGAVALLAAADAISGARAWHARSLLLTRCRGAILSGKLLAALSLGSLRSS